MQYTLLPRGGERGTGWTLIVGTSGPVHRLAVPIDLPFDYDTCVEIRDAIVAQHWVEMNDEQEFTEQVAAFFRDHPEWTA